MDALDYMGWNESSSEREKRLKIEDLEAKARNYRITIENLSEERDMYIKTYKSFKEVNECLNKKLSVLENSTNVEDIQRKDAELGALKKSSEKLKQQNSELLKKTYLKKCDCDSKSSLMISLEQQNAEMTKRISELEKVANKQKSDEESKSKVCLSLEKKNAELIKALSDLEKKMTKERVGFEKDGSMFATEKAIFDKISSDFSKRISEEKKVVELRCLKLSKQVSEFEKVLILEREKFENERKFFDEKRCLFEKVLKRTPEETIAFELQSMQLVKQVSEFEKELILERAKFAKEQKVFTAKNVALSRKISDLEETLEKERKELDFEIKESEKRKSKDLKKNV